MRDAALAALAWFPFHGPKKQSLLTQVLQEHILPIIDNSEERPLLRSRACMALVALIDHLDGTRSGSGGHVNDSFDSLRDEDFFDSDDEFLVGDKNVERDRARMEANKEVFLSLSRSFIINIDKLGVVAGSRYHTTMYATAGGASSASILHHGHIAHTGAIHSHHNGPTPFFFYPMDPRDYPRAD